MESPPPVRVRFEEDWDHSDTVVERGGANSEAEGHDFLFPYETSQVPLFELLGAGAKDKRHVVADSGHVPPNDLLAKEMLEWLDRYLGVPRPASDVRLREPTRGQ
jgi:hypothetical protein